MHYKKVLKRIRAGGYTQILVTGPQRSGTRITSKIIAHELGFRYIDELNIQNDNIKRLFKLYTEQQNFVLQAPALAFFCHRMPGAVVFNRRDVQDIMRSEIRTNWTSEKELRRYFYEEGNISEIKYEIFDKFQRNKKNVFELHYDSLKDHPFYVPPEDRTNFTRRQTKKDPE